MEEQTSETTKTPAADSVQVEPAAENPTDEEVARLAYAYWEERGCQGGSAEDDWFRAEKTVRVRRAAAGGSAAH